MSFQRLPVHLPPELIFITLYYLYKDQDFETLAACALVNRQWKRPSQDRLFSKLCIRLGESLGVDNDGDDMMIDGPAKLNDPQYERFAGLINILEQSPRLIAHTSSVSIILHPSSTPGPIWGHLFPLVARILKLAQHVRCFELGGFFDHPTLHESGVVDAMHQLLETTSLKKLTFTRCGHTAVNTLTTLVGNEELRIPPTYILSDIYDDDVDNQEIENRWTWTIDNFEILNTSYAVVSRILCAEPHKVKLSECLTLDLVDDTELEKFMDLMSHSLKRLKLSIKTPRTSLDQYLIDMNSFDALRHLTIQCAWDPNDGRNYESVYNLMDTFSDSNRLRSLELISESFLGTTPLTLRMDTSDMEPLRQLDQLLSEQERFPRLQTVKMSEGWQYGGDLDDPSFVSGARTTPV
ncbi:hypothetical protein ONZ45_g15188 [Pleurotus djamor]|nr:hypothetical protein ONZ45_g15188 [Pleurotus djamor]